MSKASTKKKIDADEDDDMPSFDSPRFAVTKTRRGANAQKRIVLPLAGIRKALGKTQVDVALAADFTQGEVSRLESQDNMMLATLERYVDALGGRLEIAVVFPPNRRIILKR